MTIINQCINEIDKLTSKFYSVIFLENNNRDWILFYDHFTISNAKKKKKKDDTIEFLNYWGSSE